MSALSDYKEPPR